MISFLFILYLRSFLRWIRCWYRYHCWKRRIQRSFCNWNVRYFQQVSFAKKISTQIFSNPRIFLFSKNVFLIFWGGVFLYLNKKWIVGLNMTQKWPLTLIWPLTFREILQLTWWPLFRDCSFYIVSLLVLIWAFYDSSITWWVIIY